MVIGMSDGLTVPFALAAGLTGAISSTGIIVTAGLAEIAAGSIAMGLGGYLATRSDIEHYASERHREEREIVEKPEAECAEVAEIFSGYGLSAEHVAPLVEALRQRPGDWVDFMMRFELGLEEIEPRRARNSALTIAGAYIAGGLIPLLPYMLLKNATSALLLSAGLTLLALSLFTSMALAVPESKVQTTASEVRRELEEALPAPRDNPRALCRQGGRPVVCHFSRTPWGC